MNKNYHSKPIGAWANTLAHIYGVHTDDASFSAEETLVQKAIEGGARRVLMFHPAGVGTEVLSLHADRIGSMHDVCPHTFELCAPVADSSKSLLSLYGGRMPQKGEETLPLLSTLKKEGKRCALLCTQASTFASACKEAGIEVYRLHDDMSVISKAVELLKADNYDLLIVQQTEFDTMLHASRLKSKACTVALDNHLNALSLLAGAIEVYSTQPTLVAFAPEHGAHGGLFGTGTHRSHSPADLNVTHYVGVVSPLRR